MTRTSGRETARSFWPSSLSPDGRTASRSSRPVMAPCATSAEIGAIVPDQMSLSPDGRYIAYDAPDQPGAADRDIYHSRCAHGQSVAPWPVAERGDGAVLDAGWARARVPQRSQSQPVVVDGAVDNGRPQGPPRFLKDDVGRAWLHGFSAAGALHYQLYAGFAEVYVASIEGRRRRAQSRLSPRRAVSNFYPEVVDGGRFVAYASERGGVGRGGRWARAVGLRHSDRLRTHGTG